MCDKCIEIDNKIRRYERLSAESTDGRVLAGIKELLVGLRAQKAALHPDLYPPGKSLTTKE